MAKSITTEAIISEPQADASTSSTLDTLLIDLDQFLPYRLTRLSQRISRGIASGYQEYNLSITEWRIMAVVARFPGSSACMLLDYTAMDKVAVHRAVQQLTNKELLQRKANPLDKRQQQLQLTENGTELYQKICPGALDYQERILEKLTSKEVNTLFTLLNKLEQQL